MPKSYRHLDFQERTLIETQLTLGIKPAVIAAGFAACPLHNPPRDSSQRLAVSGRARCGAVMPGSPAVIARFLADRRARVLARRPRVARKLVADSPLWKLVVEYLCQGLSPAQIARTLARMPDPVRLSYETIYTAFYAMPKGHLRSSLLGLMRQGHRARRPHRGKARHKTIPEMTLIDQRPGEVQDRLIPGHWEGDLIIGKGNLSQVGTLVERTTLFVALVKLSGTNSEITAEAFSGILNRFDSQLRRSMTYDQGTEMRHHKRLTKNTGVAVYFAHPHAPWERGICVKHQRIAAPVSAEGHRPLPVLSRTTGRYRMAAQHSAKKNSELESSRRTLPPRKVRSTSSSTGLLNSHLLHLNPESAVPHSSRSSG